MKAVALAACVGAATLTQHALAEPTATSPAQAHFRLSNGLDVLIEENHREPHVAVLVSYDIGSRDEPEGLASLAHLVEHLTFRRSRHLGDYGGLEQLGRAGAEAVNGETHDDRTLYYEVVPSKALPLALWIESERMGFTLEAFDDAAVAHERDVIRAELQSNQTGRNRLLTHVVNTLYGAGHPYSQPGGPEQGLDDIRLGEAQWFFQRGYRPDNAHLVIVGDVTLADGRELVTRYFGGLKNPAVPLAPRPLPAPARWSEQQLVYRTREVDSFFFAAYRVPPRDAPSHLAAELLEPALRLLLTPVLVEQRRVARFLKVGLVETAVDSQLVLQIVPRQGITPAELERTVRAALEGVTPERVAEILPEARALLLEREWAILEAPLARARMHVEALAFGGLLRDAEARIAAVRKLSEADVAPLLPSLRVPLLVGKLVHDPDVGRAGALEVR